MAASLLIARIALGSVFLMSGLTKAVAPAEFAANLRKYRVMPPALAGVVARVLPCVETAAGGLLLLGVYPAWAARTCAIMLAGFMAAVGVVMVRRQNLDRTCFGLLYRERVGWTTEMRDGILLALFSVGLRGGRWLPIPREAAGECRPLEPRAGSVRDSGGSRAEYRCGRLERARGSAAWATATDATGRRFFRQRRGRRFLMAGATRAGTPSPAGLHSP